MRSQLGCSLVGTLVRIPRTLSRALLFPWCRKQKELHNLKIKMEYTVKQRISWNFNAIYKSLDFPAAPMYFSFVVANEQIKCYTAWAGAVCLSRRALLSSSSPNKSSQQRVQTDERDPLRRLELCTNINTAWRFVADKRSLEDNLGSSYHISDSLFLCVCSFSHQKKLRNLTLS